MNDQAARQYLSRVKRRLICGREDRRRLLKKCREMVDDFQQENPGAGYDGLVAAFGAPAFFSAELLSGLEESGVAAARRKRRLLRLGTLIAMFAILCSIAFFWYDQYMRSMNINEHAIVVKGNPEIMSDEEFDAVVAQIRKDKETAKHG